uniref:Uncharacterized protein n=1 Tax=Rhabditophanes sp. KR3021 TaxID=114890 RepID=A0AC35U8J0_9BILA
MASKLPNNAEDFDPAAFWKASIKLNDPKSPDMVQTVIGGKFNSDRSAIWSTLSMMNSNEQVKFISKIVNYWPNDLERRAFNWPVHLNVVSCAITTSLVAAKVNSDFFLLDKKIPFLESIRRCPKAPFVMGVYVSGITVYVLNQLYVYNLLFKETDPCESCVLTRSIVCGLVSGVIMPMVSVPYLSYYVMMQQKNMKFPPVKSYIEFAALSFEGVKACRRILPLVFGIQILASAGGAYSALWGRSRIFKTMDVDPEYMQSALRQSQKSIPLKERVEGFLQKLPVFGSLVNSEPDLK